MKPGMPLKMNGLNGPLNDHGFVMLALEPLSLPPFPIHGLVLVAAEAVGIILMTAFFIMLFYGYLIAAIGNALEAEVRNHHN